MECCQYFILQTRSYAGNWLDTEVNSKSFQEILKASYTYQQQHPEQSIRIQQRNLDEDRKLGRRVPQCC